MTTPTTEMIDDMIAASEAAQAAMIDSLDLDYGVGNEEFEDVKTLQAALDQLTSATDALKSGTRSLGRSS